MQPYIAQDQKSSSPLNNSLRVPCALEAQCNSSWRASTMTKFKWWREGVKMICSPTSKNLPKISRWNWQHTWYKTGNMHSPHSSTEGKTSNMLHQVWSSYNPTLGSSWGPGARLEIIWKLKHALSQHHMPVEVVCSNNHLMPRSGTVVLFTIACWG